MTTLPPLWTRHGLIQDQAASWAGLGSAAFSPQYLLLARNGVGPLKCLGMSPWTYPGSNPMIGTLATPQVTPVFHPE